jgi:hypothetical protein
MEVRLLNGHDYSKEHAITTVSTGVLEHVTGLELLSNGERAIIRFLRDENEPPPKALQPTVGLLDVTQPPSQDNEIRVPEEGANEDCYTVRMPIPNPMTRSEFRDLQKEFNLSTAEWSRYLGLGYSTICRFNTLAAKGHRPKFTRANQAKIEKALKTKFDKSWSVSSAN